ERAKQLAATVLEADPADIVIDVEAATIGVAGVPANALTWGGLAKHADSYADGSREAEAVFTGEGSTFPFGTHIAVVEVDTETGRARLVRHRPRTRQRPRLHQAAV